MSHAKGRSGSRNAALALIAGAALVALTTMPAFAVEKEWICHAAGQSETAKFVAIEISDQGGSDNSKAAHFNEDGTTKSGHEEDFLLVGDFEDKDAATEACNAPEPTATPTPTGEVNEGTPTPTATPGGGQLGGTPTPTPAPVPNTATSALQASVAALALSVLLIGSLVAMGYARIRQAR